MSRVIFIFIGHLIVTVILCGCTNSSKEIAFEKGKWSEQKDPAFPPPYRSMMTKDLTTNYKLKGLKYSQLIDLLGIPDDKDSSTMSYKIIVEFGSDIDPIYTKNLDFSFSKDSTITSFKFEEWRKKR